ncbi:MAG: LysR family transcriptional regulator [Eubacteriales bacterium]|nr:LysR family transcriptional regulator [Eubacteriales bacterium]
MYNPLLLTFLTIADCGSFHKAAEALFITPASVMNQLNTLENHLGLQLFSRSRQGLTITAAGKVIYRDARKFIRESEKSIEKAKAAQNAAARTIRIGSSFLNPCHVFLDLWKQHAENANAYNFKIIPYDDDHTQLLSVISRLGKDIDILVGAFNSEQIHRLADYLILGTYDLCIALSPQHALAAKPVLDLPDLYGQRLVIPMQEGPSDLLTFLRQHPQILVEQTHYFYDMDTFNYCEQNNCLLLTLSAWSDVHPSLLTLPVSWDQKVPYGLLYARDCSRELSSFMDYTRSILSA